MKQPSIKQFSKKVTILTKHQIQPLKGGAASNVDNSDTNILIIDVVAL